MKKIVLRLHKIDYALVHWSENKLTPWVAAWAPSEEGGLHWGQGHYFGKKKQAVEYLVGVYKERVLDRRSFNPTDVQIRKERV